MTTGWAKLASLVALDTVSFMSYNSTGLDSSKIKFSNDLCDEYDIDFLALQEHLFCGQKKQPSPDVM